MNFNFNINTIPSPNTPEFQLFRLPNSPNSPNSDCSTSKRSPSSPMTNRLLKMSGSGFYGRSPICTPFPIATPEAPQISSNNSTSTIDLAKENESLREELRRAKLALQASEERCSEVEKENTGLTEVLSEALDLLEHRAAVHNTRVASLERELQEKNELERANERLLKEKQKHMASFSVRLDSCLLVGWLVLLLLLLLLLLLGFYWFFVCYFRCFFAFFLKVNSTRLLLLLLPFLTWQINRWLPQPCGSRWATTHLSPNPRTTRRRRRRLLQHLFLGRHSWKRRRRRSVGHLSRTPRKRKKRRRLVPQLFLGHLFRRRGRRRRKQSFLHSCWRRRRKKKSCSNSNSNSNNSSCYHRITVRHL
jgi:hypothetical protein